MDVGPTGMGELVRTQEQKQVWRCVLRMPVFQGLVKEEGGPEKTPKGKEANEERGLEAQGRGSPGRKQIGGKELRAMEVGPTRAALCPPGLGSKRWLGDLGKAKFRPMNRR